MLSLYLYSNAKNNLYCYPNIIVTYSQHWTFGKYQLQLKTKLHKDGYEKYLAKHETAGHEDGWNYRRKGNLRLDIQKWQLQLV